MQDSFVVSFVFLNPHMYESVIITLYISVYSMCQQCA